MAQLKFKWLWILVLVTSVACGGMKPKKPGGGGKRPGARPPAEQNDRDRNRDRDALDRRDDDFQRRLDDAALFDGIQNRFGQNDGFGGPNRLGELGPEHGLGFDVGNGVFNDGSGRFVPPGQFGNFQGRPPEDDPNNPFDILPLPTSLDSRARSVASEPGTHSGRPMAPLQQQRLRPVIRR